MCEPVVLAKLGYQFLVRAIEFVTLRQFAVMKSEVRDFGFEFKKFFFSSNAMEELFRRNDTFGGD